MIRRIGMIFLVGMLPLAAAAAVPEAEFATGNEAFWKGDFDAASAAYARIIELGVHDADVYYNLGTAEAEAGRLGMATWALEQALRLRPSHGDAAHNAEQVRTQIVEKGLEQSGDRRVILPGSDDLGTGLFTAFEPGSLTLVFAALWTLLFVWIALVRRIADPARRTAAAFAAVVLAMIAIGTGGLLAGRVFVVNRAHYGVVVADKATVVSGPGNQYRPIADVLAGVKIELRGDEGDWHNITLPDGASGWLASEAVRPLLTP